MSETEDTMPDAPRKNQDRPGTVSLLGTASTMGLHMVSGPIVGGGLGWLVDHWLGSWPVGAAIGLILGLAAGFRNVWIDARYLARVNAEADAEARERAAQQSSSGDVSGSRKALTPDRGEDEQGIPGRKIVIPDSQEMLREDEEELAALVASIQAGTAAPRAAREPEKKSGALDQGQAKSPVQEDE